MEALINELSTTIIKKLHRKFKYADCNKSANAYFESAKIVKAETDKYLKKIISSKKI